MKNHRKIQIYGIRTKDRFRNQMWTWYQAIRRLGFGCVHFGCCVYAVATSSTRIFDWNVLFYGICRYVSSISKCVYPTPTMANQSHMVLTLSEQTFSQESRLLITLLKIQFRACSCQCFLRSIQPNPPTQAKETPDENKQTFQGPLPKLVWLSRYIVWFCLIFDGFVEVWYSETHVPCEKLREIIIQYT